MKRRLSPVFRLSLGLAALTVSLLLAAELFGILPDQTKAKLEARQKISETLALQLSWAALNNDRRAIQQTLDTVVARNPDVLSAALLNDRTGALAKVGEHDSHWSPPEDGRSTPTDVQVPIYTDRGQWGSLQLSFAPLREPGELSTWVRSTAGLVVFVGIAGFLLFAVFLRRALRQLDPSRVIPAHVKAAFDALAEGVLIMDDEENIVLANRAFARLLGFDTNELTGRKASTLGWLAQTSTDEEPVKITTDLPWQLAIANNSMEVGLTLMLEDSAGKQRTVTVNSAPIADGDGGPRGALATFDDVSELQENHSILQGVLSDLAASKEKVSRQNAELKILASRDPLTHCLNRRAMLEGFEVVFNRARVEQLPLSCAMVDIDRFKAFNDRYGHAAGDKVLKFVARILRSGARKQDLVARYGGEEFCLIMPGLTSANAVAVTERVCATIKHDFAEAFVSSQGLTISIGVAELVDHTDTMDALLKRADDALYTAKENGRDQVVPWGTELARKTGEERSGYAQEAKEDSTLVQVLEQPTETLRVITMNERVLELDAILEGKSSEVHQEFGFDELTGLPKRILFYDRVAQYLPAAQRDGHSVAVLYLDIDLQRRIGDELEPVMGDQLIKAATDRLATALAHTTELAPLLKEDEEHTLARLGENDFGLVLPNMVDTEAATWIVQKLFEHMDKPLTVDGEEIYANCSIGISLYPSDGEDAKTLMGRASQARHLAHSNKGRHKYLFYAEEMNVRSYEQLMLESQLRKAVANEELVLHYQPVYNLTSGRIAGFEALLRWNNPEMGMVGPAMFMHIAEQTGLIVPIGEWALREACVQAKKWLDSRLGDLQIAVNLSTVQLREEDLQQTVLDTLTSTGLPSSWLELEVTETAIMDDVVKAHNALDGLREKGVSIAMDDFGTGYSSLTHFKHMTVDKLKIDRSFVNDVIEDSRDAAVVSSIIAMAKLMDLEVVAEGVETREQLGFLKRRGCDMAQGFLLSRPVSAAQAEELLLDQLDTGEATAADRVAHETLKRKTAKTGTAQKIVETAS